MREGSNTAGSSTRVVLCAHVTFGGVSVSACRCAVRWAGSGGRAPLPRTPAADGCLLRLYSPPFHNMGATLILCARLLQLRGRGGGPVHGMQTGSDRRNGVPSGLHRPRRSRHHRCVRLRWSPATCCAAVLASHVEPCAENDIAIFHISLWSSVFLVMATCYGGCMLTYMDTGDDSIFNIDISDAVKKAN